jgi:ribokinase
MAILAIGTLSFDLIATAATPFRDDSLTIPLDDIIRTHGGRGGNFAVFSRALGVDIDLVASVGDDFYASSYASVLKDRGVNISNLYRNEAYETQKVFLFANQDDCRVYIYRDRSAGLESAFQQWAADQASRRKYVAMYCTSEVPAVNLGALRASPSQLKVFAPAHDLDLYDEECLRQCVDLADVVLANQAEAEVIKSVLSADSSIVNRRLRAFVTTRGPAGSVIDTPSGSFDVPACAPQKVIDTTGAGDAYAAGFVSEMAATGDLLRAARMGSVVSSFAIESIGCQTSVPTGAQVTRRSSLAYG